jgi:hypothetical protein
LKQYLVLISVMIVGLSGAMPAADDVQTEYAILQKIYQDIDAVAWESGLPILERTARIQNAVIDGLGRIETLQEKASIDANFPIDKVVLDALKGKINFYKNYPTISFAQD